MAKGMSPSRKRRVYEVCLSVFFVFSTSACANMGGGTSSLDDDLDVDLLAVLTEPEEKDMELEAAQNDAEMLTEYQQGNSDTDEGAVLEGVSDPFGDAFSGSSAAASEVAEEPTGTIDDLEVEAPIVSENESPDGQNDIEHARAGLEATGEQEKKDLSLAPILENQDLLEESAPETVQDNNIENYLDLNEDESVDFLLEGEGGEQTSVIDNNVNNEKGEEQTDEMLLAAMGEDSAGFADDEDDAILENGNKYEFQDSFLSDVIAGQDASAGKNANFLAETSFEPNSEVPEELDDGDLEIDMGAMVASMQTDQMLPTKASLPDSMVAKVPTSQLVHPEIVRENRIVAAVTPETSELIDSSDQEDADLESLEQSTLALLTATGEKAISVVLPTITASKVLRSDNRLASANGAVAKISTEHAQTTAENRVNNSESIKKTQVASLPKIRPDTLHLRMLRDPKTVAYSGKLADPSTPEMFVKVYIDGRPAIVSVKKPQSTMNTAQGSNSERAVKTASVKSRTPAVTLEITSLKILNKQQEKMPIRLALSTGRNGMKVVSSVQAKDDNRADNGGSKEKDSSHFDLTNKLILPKREELIFG